MVRYSRMAALAALAGGAAFVGSAWAGGEPIRPQGVFFHSYTGSFSGIEWIHIWEIEGADRYRFSDIRGIAPYDGQILPNGQITWDTTPSTSGSGQFTSQDTATQTLFYQGGAFPSTLRRAPGTDASFLTRIDSRTDGDAAIAGTWDLSITELDAATGDVLGSTNMRAITEVNGDLLSLVYDDGTSFTGVFEDADHAGFRVLSADAFLGEFASFEGSETSLALNLMGDFRMDGLDAFEAVFLTQTRTQPGNQQQFVHVLSGARVPAPGVSLIGAMGVVMCRRRR